MKKITSGILILFAIIGIVSLFIFANDYLKSDKPYNELRDSTYSVYALPVPDSITFAGDNIPIERYDVREALDKELHKDPNNTRYLYYMAREWLNRQQVLNAIFYFERYIKISPPTNELADVYYVLATCYFTTGDTEKAIDLCLQAIKYLPSFKAPWTLLTNMALPSAKKYWLAGANNADNKGVLFVRDQAEQFIK